MEKTTNPSSKLKINAHLLIGDKMLLDDYPVQRNEYFKRLGIPENKVAIINTIKQKFNNIPKKEKVELHNLSLFASYTKKIVNTYQGIISFKDPSDLLEDIDNAFKHPTNNSLKLYTINMVGNLSDLVPSFRIKYFERWEKWNIDGIEEVAILNKRDWSEARKVDISGGHNILRTAQIFIPDNYRYYITDLDFPFRIMIYGNKIVRIFPSKTSFRAYSSASDNDVSRFKVFFNKFCDLKSYDLQVRNREVNNNCYKLSQSLNEKTSGELIQKLREIMETQSFVRIKQIITSLEDHAKTVEVNKKEVDEVLKFISTYFTNICKDKLNDSGEQVISTRASFDPDADALLYLRSLIELINRLDIQLDFKKKKVNLESFEDHYNLAKLLFVLIRFGQDMIETNDLGHQVSKYFPNSRTSTILGHMSKLVNYGLVLQNSNDIYSLNRKLLENFPNLFCMK